MVEKNIEDVLDLAKKGIKRTQSKKNIKGNEAGESLSARLARLAEYKAEEELYKEEYRQRLNASDSAPQSTRVTKTDEEKTQTSDEKKAFALNESDLPPDMDGIDNTEKPKDIPSVDENVSLTEEQKEDLYSTADETPSDEPCTEALCFESITEPAVLGEDYASTAESCDFNDVGENPGYVNAFDFEEYVFNTYGINFSQGATYDEFFDSDSVDMPYTAEPDVRPIKYSSEWEPELDDYHDLPVNFEDNDYREVYMPYKPEKLYPSGEMYPEMSDIEMRDMITELDDIDYSADDIEDNVRLVEARLLHESRMLKNRHKMLGYRFSLDESEVYRSRKKVEKDVNRRLSKLTKAKRCERAANIRYYLAADDKCIGSERKRIKNAAKIDSIRKRLDFLLAERSTINKRLIELYAGADEGRGKNNADRWLGKAVKRAKDVYKSQKRLARRVIKFKAPEVLRSKIIDLMNEKIEAYAKLEELTQRLRNGRLSRSATHIVKREIREQKKKIRYTNSDLKYLVRRAEKHHTIYYENGKQLAWIFGTLIVLAVIIGVYLALGGT